MKMKWLDWETGITWDVRIDRTDEPRLVVTIVRFRSELGDFSVTTPGLSSVSALSGDELRELLGRAVPE